MFKTTIALIAVMAASTASAESLRFEAINPSFGGNPLNGSHLMGLATRQYTPPVVERVKQTDLEYFADQIQRRTLSAISSAFTQNLRDIDLNDPNSELPDDFVVGDFRISYGAFEGNIVLTLEQDGETIEIIVPDF
jgi:curli production assembly/transport component CsgF